MRSLSQLSARAKLLAGFLSVAIIAAAIGAFGIERVSRLSNMITVMSERDVRGLSELKDISTAFARVGRVARQTIFETDRAKVQAQIETIDASFDTCQESLSLVEGTMVTPNGKALVATISKGLPDYRAAVTAITRHSLANDDEAAIAAIARMKETGDIVEGAIVKAIENKEEVLAATCEDANQMYHLSRNLLVGVMAGGVFLSVLLGYLLSRWLETALTEVSGIAESFAGASQQLSAASEEIASGAQEQASNLEETASSLEEITSTIKQNADNAQQANQLATGAREVAERGGEVVGDAVEAMKAINQSSKKIAEIITAIDEIAFQTNLLALNAAVEAARAGEQGRGFAVVAGEVRNLAQRSAGAAKEIKDLIQDSVRKVEAGSELVNKSGQTLQDIVQAVKRVTDIVSEIAAASREQSTGVDQVSRAVAQMDQVTQTNASQTEELSGTAESLSSKAQELQELVTRVKSGGGAPVKVTASRPAQRVAATSGRRTAAKKSPARRPEPAAWSDSAADGNDFANGDLELVGAGAGNDRSFEEF